LTEQKQRTSAVSFRIDRNQIRKNSDGSIDVPGHLTRTGVFEYKRGKETVRELRSDAEVFSEKSLDSLRSVLVTKDHPPEFLTTDNWREFAIGHVAHVSADPPYVSGKLRVHDAAAIHMIEQGFLKEVSCGYACTPKAVSREDADIEQTELEYNHVAIGPEGWSRLGTALRLDSNNQEVITPAVAEKELNMDELNEALKPVLDAIQGIQTRIDALEARPDKPKKTEDSPVKKPEVVPDPDAIERMVQERVDQLLNLELEARDAYEAFFPEDYIEPKRCARKLCEEILKTVDSNLEISEETDIAPMVREAQLLAKQKRQDARAKQPNRESIALQLQGGVPARLLDHETDYELPAALR